MTTKKNTKGNVDVKKAQANDVDKEELETKGKAPIKGKSSTKAKPTADAVTRLGTIGRVMRENPKATADAIVKMADDIYSKATGRESNIKESRWCYEHAVRFLKGYNSK